MKFTVAAVLAFASMAMAYPSSAPVERRQANLIPAVDASIPAMTNARGEILPFVATAVYKDSTARGI